MPSLRNYLDRRAPDLTTDDGFTLSAVRRSDFAASHVTEARRHSLYAMIFMDRHGRGTVLFAEVCYPEVNDGEALLPSFVDARGDTLSSADPHRGRAVGDDMSVQLAGAAQTIEATMLPVK